MVHNKLKIWWHPLVILNKKKNFLNVHDNILKLKVHFDWIARWKGLDKILMYIKYITYKFSMAIGLHVYDSWNIAK